MVNEADILHYYIIENYAYLYAWRITKKGIALKKQIRGKYAK